MSAKPIPKQQSFEAIRITVDVGVIRVGPNNFGEWVAFWGILAIVTAAGVGVARLCMSPSIDPLGCQILVILYLGVGGGPLVWAIGWRLAFKQMLWLYPMENVAEYRWMWHRKTYRSTWFDLSQGELEIVGRQMQVRTDEQDIGALIAFGCLGALLGPLGALVGAFASRGKTALKRVPILSLRQDEETVIPIAMFAKNKEARQVITAWKNQRP